MTTPSPEPIDTEDREADPADLVEQNIDVPLDDDGYPSTSRTD